MPRTPVTSSEVERITRAGREETRDLIAVEEPLQILLEHGEGPNRLETPLAMTMRTPGHDRDLVMGFLFAEGVITAATDVLRLRHCVRSDTAGNVIRAALREGLTVPKHLLERALPMTSACGVCGERTLEALTNAGCQPLHGRDDRLHPDAVRAALDELEFAQSWFRHTGGTHGAALFDDLGELRIHREDVGRHNALDKLVGARLGDGIPPVDGEFIVVSSRASFELVQKCVRARIPLMVAIGAPTSLAIDTARHFGVTLIGFAKRDRFNVYACSDRILEERGASSFIEVGAAE
jgi:FdhD protein